MYPTLLIVPLLAILLSACAMGSTEFSSNGSVEAGVELESYEKVLINPSSLPPTMDKLEETLLAKNYTVVKASKFEEYRNSDSRSLVATCLGKPMPPPFGYTGALTFVRCELAELQSRKRVYGGEARFALVCFGCGGTALPLPEEWAGATAAALKKLPAISQATK